MSWTSLTDKQQKQFARNCVSRRAAYVKWLSTGKIDSHKTILIVGDRPGPKAPQVSDYHHTPFYAKTYSGGWLNSQLVLNEINEQPLFWINSASFDGVPTDATTLLRHNWNSIIALGKNAFNWCLKVGFNHPAPFDHPQYHRRFKSQERYLLLDWLLNKQNLETT